MKKVSILEGVIAVLLFLSTAHADVWYVHPDSALNTIQAGLDSCTDNDIVLVGPGTYFENIIWPSTQGIDLLSQWGPEVTIIDASGPKVSHGIGIWLSVDSTTIIRGFTIQRGSSGGRPGSGLSIGAGPGESCTPVITRNIIIDNADFGIVCGSASPIIDSCIISNNSDIGVRCDYGSTPTINYCNITTNGGYGVQGGGPTAWVDAQYNWWGDASGPGGAGPGTGDEVSDYVDYDPWLTDSVHWVAIGEQPIVKAVEKRVNLGATIFRGPLLLPKGRKCKVYDITGRVVEPDKIQPGIYFIEVDGKITQKVVKVR